MRLTRAVFLAALLAAPSIAWPRAGGGQSFSGSRSSSSGSRSSSSSSSSSRSSGGGFSSSRSTSSGSWSTSPSSDSYPTYSRSGSSSDGGSAALIFILILFVVGVGIVLVVAMPLLRTLGAGSASSALEDAWQRRRAQNQQSAEDLQRALEAIRARDASFDVPAFILSARKAFVEVQHAWSAGDFAAAHRLVSDGVLKRFTAQLALNEVLGKRNVTADLQVRNANLAAVESDAAFDTLHVRFEASLRDCDVPAGLKDGAALARAAKAPATEFAEIWSFVRRLTPGGKAGALSEGRCPNCGAPALRVPNATCPYCQAVLNSGAYDWVLSEITQESEFECQSQTAVAGLAALRQVDKDANRQVLEDRASLVFWKWVAAQGTGKLESFERLCVPEVFQQLRESATQLEGVEQCAVGGVDLLGVDGLGESSKRQRALFLIRWSTSGAGTGLVRTNVLALARDARVRTRAELGLSTDRCHHCGAPQQALDAVHCGHCQALLSQDWSFLELGDPETLRPSAEAGAAAQAPEGGAGALADPRERRRILAALVAMARADGEVSAQEWELLESYAQRWSIERSYLDGLFAAPANQLLDLRPRSKEAARALYGALCAAAWADGKLDASERRMLQMAAESLQIAAAERAEIERAAKGGQLAV